MTNLPPGIRFVYKKYQASIFVDGLQFYIGSYNTLPRAISKQEQAKMLFATLSNKLSFPKKWKEANLYLKRDLELSDLMNVRANERKR